MTVILRRNQDNVYVCKGTLYYIGRIPCAVTLSAINNTSTRTSNSLPCCIVGRIHVVDNSPLNCHAPIAVMVATIMWRMGDGWATFISRACIWLQHAAHHAAQSDRPLLRTTADNNHLNCHAPIAAMVVTTMWRMGDGWATFISRTCIWLQHAAHHAAQSDGPLLRTTADNNHLNCHPLIPCCGQ